MSLLILASSLAVSDSSTMGSALEMKRQNIQKACFWKKMKIKTSQEKC